VFDPAELIRMGSWHAGLPASMTCPFPNPIESFSGLLAGARTNTRVSRISVYND
jgi:hypothetical protein